MGGWRWRCGCRWMDGTDSRESAETNKQNNSITMIMVIKRKQTIYIHIVYTTQSLDAQG